MLHELPDGTAAIVMTTWAFAYLSVEDRETFVAVLDEASRKRPLAWLSAEGAGTVPAFAEGAAAQATNDGVSDVLGAMLFDRGRRHAQLLAFAQEHGAQLDWRDP